MNARLIYAGLISMISLPAIGIGVLMYDEKIRNHKYAKLSKLFDELEKKDIRRYNVVELNEVVGKTPVDKWSQYQVDRLDSMYKTRRDKKSKEWATINAEMDKNQEKNGGLFSLVRCGPPDYYKDKNEYYNSFKTYSDEEI